MGLDREGYGVDDLTTIKKTRLVAQNQQALRVDFEDPKPIESEHVKQIITFINANQFDMILLSDYNKGMLTKELTEELKKLDIQIVVDPKPSNMMLFKDSFVIAPNIKEAKEITNSNNSSTELSKLIAEKYNTLIIKIIMNFSTHSVYSLKFECFIFSHLFNKCN